MGCLVPEPDGSEDEGPSPDELKDSGLARLAATTWHELAVDDRRHQQPVGQLGEPLWGRSVGAVLGKDLLGVDLGRYRCGAHFSALRA